MKRPSLVQTLFLSARDVAAIVNKVGPAATLRGMADYIHEDYLRWQDFDKCARVASHSADGVIELMPIADAKTYAFKYVNGHPRNTRLGLPTVMAFGVLADVITGVPELLSELTLTTALRTAAMSAVAARALARPSSQCMALIGNGAQSEFQALAFHHLLGIREIRLFDTDRAATAKFMHNLQHTALRLTACASIAEAVRGADIVTTVTADKTNATILTPDLIEPGMHINGVGGDCPGKTELHPDVLLGASVFVEYEPQTRTEGDLQQLPADFAVTELWQVLRAQAPGRTHDSQVTLFDSVGFALEDYSALRYMRDAARQQGLGQLVSLIPELANPKDLFSLIRPMLLADANALPEARRPELALASMKLAPPTNLAPRAVSLIGAPTDIGAGTMGARMGPEALRVAGIAQAIAQFGIDVKDCGNLLGPANPWQEAVNGFRHLSEVAQWNQTLHDAVYAELQQQRLPILLGGDHSLAIGSISAVARHCRDQGKKLRVLWFDAHADFNTATLTPSGNIHGMPVACLCGHGPAELTGMSGVVPALNPKSIRQIGIRSVDAGEQRLVHDIGIEVFDMRYIDEMGMRHAMELALALVDANTHLHVSLDVDFLDPDIAPGVGTTVRGGPTYREAQLCMEMIADTGRLASLDLVELNPALDVRNQTAELAVDLIQSLFGKSTLMRRNSAQL